MELRGSAALVTGGAHRLGKAVALALAAAGANIVIHYHRSAEQADATVAELHALGVEAHALGADLAQVPEAERLVDTALERLGGLNLLVNCAGIWGAMPFGEITAEQWDAQLDTNLRSSFFVSQRAAPALRATRGAIVNIADAGALKPWRNYVPYLVSKGGVVTLTEALAKDLAPEIRVNAVAPGPVLLPDDWDAEQAEKSARTVLLRRVGSPDDVAQAVVYLAQAEYVTGVTLPVDGGYRLR